MRCSNVCAATMGAVISTTILGGTYCLKTTPFLVLLRDQPAAQDQILSQWAIVSVTASVVGASLGVLANQVVKCAYRNLPRKMIVSMTGAAIGVGFGVLSNPAAYQLITGNQK